MWLIAAQYGLLYFGMMDAAWWIAHGLEVVGIGLIGIPAALDLRCGVASRPLVGDLRATDLVAHEEAFLGGRVRALMLRLAAKDRSTEHHTRRVAALAVQIGEEIGVPNGRLRLLALGGLLHDMGKLSVPDEYLNKPGALTDDEFDDHPSPSPIGARPVLAELGGFAPLVLRLVGTTTSASTPAQLPEPPRCQQPRSRGQDSHGRRRLRRAHVRPGLPRGVAARTGA